MINIIGIDCATQENKTGLALGSLVNGKLVISEVTCGSKNSTSLSIITQWLSKSDIALIAMDSPLGWPSQLGQELDAHKAGMIFKIEANDMFSRATDLKVLKVLRKKPMEVGADKIARTAHRALKLLHEIQSTTGHAIPLAWSNDIHETSAIEVYPAATLKSYGIDTADYKKEAKREKWHKIANRLPFEVPKEDITSADKLDAVICLLAAKDFLDGHCLKPDNIELAKKEGWIWFHNR
ncbi:MAG: DUF429 domain-containing protein [Dehalococcoidales bacterium]|nr:DUF429 domain-containing protein [Dehalococcoidales bacterium]